MVLILADFPNERTRHEGMAQRILAVDKQLESVDRQYLFVSHRRFFRKQHVPVIGAVTQNRCNLFRHFFFILRLLRNASTIYVHSVINLLPILPLLPLLNKTTVVVLDAHGIVPEEQQLAGRNIKARLYAIAEQMIFRRANRVLVVTNAMETHFCKKYPQSTPDYVRYSILPAHLNPEQLPPLEKPITPEGVLRVVYSGNLQSWQNIDLMIQLIQANLSNRIQYDILTGEPEAMKDRLSAAGIDTPNVHVQTVAPSELSRFYQAAHYGIILRDDIAVNRVACPTKLVEYLFYGMIPIVKSVHIGDFAAMGYEYLTYEAFSVHVAARKSSINQTVARTLIRQNRQTDLTQVLTK